KWLVVMCGAVATLAIAFGSSAYTAAIPGIMAHFGVSITAATAGVAVFVLGFAIGPLFWAPLGELFGRQIWFWTTYAAVTIFAWAAGYTDSFAALIVLCFLGGATGASVLSNAGGVISDVMNEKERGLGLAFFSFAPFMGPVLGPICGGFEAMAVGWRWVLYTIAIFTGVVLVLGAVVVPETYGPALLAKRAAALSDYTGLHFVRASKRPQKSAAQLFKIALSRPWQLLFLEPITLAVCLYQAIIYGTLYMLFGAFPVVYRR
ncbi:MFS general substrate transporter, partial [Caulochytrium protostelioides]